MNKDIEYKNKFLFKLRLILRMLRSKSYFVIFLERKHRDKATIHSYRCGMLSDSDNEAMVSTAANLVKIEMHNRNIDSVINEAKELIKK